MLHSFDSGTDGGGPNAYLINAGGIFYGTTAAGRAYGYGTVFSLTTAGVENVLHRFGGDTTDGGRPFAGLINVCDTLYGTTYEGGANLIQGTVFSITTGGTENVLR